MKKIILVIFAVFFVSALSKADSPKIHPYLLNEMQNVENPQQKFPIFILFNDHLTLSDFADISYNTPKDERRRIVIERLKNFADNYQNSMRNFLQSKESSRSVEFVEHLWINNSIRLEANSEVIYDIASNFDEVQIIGFDKAHPIEMLVDWKEERAPFIGASIQNPAPQIGLNLIRAPQVWALGINGTGVLVGNSDDGFQWRHQDLVNRTFQNLGEDANNNGMTIIYGTGLTSTYDPGDLNGIDDDANGKVDDLVGWDYSINSGQITSSSHGTSTFGQVSGDGTMGTATGVAPGSKNMVMRNTAGESAQWAAFQYALEMGAHVTTSSLSWKWYMNPKPNYFQFRLVCDMSLAGGMVHTNSTSNDGNSQTSAPIPMNISSAGNVPAPWVHPDQTLVGGIGGVIGVGNIVATTDIIATSSPYGPAAWTDFRNLGLPGVYPYPPVAGYEDYPYSKFNPANPDSMGLIKPDVSAPGQGTTSTSTSNGYSSFSGTSSATPHTAGLVALMLDVNPEMLPQDVAKVIQLTAIDKGPTGKDNRYGAGRIDALNATTSPKFYMEGIAGGSNMFMASTFIGADTAKAIAGFKIWSDVSPEVGSLKQLLYNVTTNATASDINSFDLYFDADGSGSITAGDVLIKSIPFNATQLDFDELKFKFVDQQRTVILAANVNSSAAGKTISMILPDTNSVSAYHTTRPFGTNFPLDMTTNIGNGNTSSDLSYYLAQNFPNPFNPATLINYVIPRDGIVTLKVYDMLGKEIATLVNGFKSRGAYTVEFDANEYRGLSSGVYYYRISAGEFTDVKRMMLIK